MRFPALMLALLISVGCSSSWIPKTPGAKRGEELRRLEERVLELQRQSRMAEVEIERLRRQVAELEGAPAASPAPAGSSAPTVPLTSPARPAPATPPIAATKASSPNPDGIAYDRPSDLRVESEELLAAPTKERSPPASVEGPVLEDSASTPQALPSAQALYDRGYTLYHQGRLLDSESAFRQFLQAHPTSDLADNAQFWIGAVRLQRGDAGAALAAFRETISRFPNGNKIPDAMLKSGECLERLGDSEEARRVYRDVLDRFPTTAAAALARERLDELP